jgi:GGDEF domain-containing protein
MEMISIKQFLDATGDSSNLNRRTIELLADTVSQHPCDFDPGASGRFKSEISEVVDGLDSEVSNEQFTRAVHAIHEALQHRNLAANDLFRNQSSELQNMIVMLTQAIRSLTSASEASSHNLDSIATDLKQASALEDIYRLRLRLSECLERVCDEAARQKNDSKDRLETLRQRLVESQQRLAHSGFSTDLDRITGFAGRSTAEAAIRSAVDEGGSRYIVLAVLERMPTINSLFGYAVGDELLCEFATALAGRMASRAVFYRWSGPAVVGILQRLVPLHVVRAEVGRVLSELHISKSIDDGEQTAFITTSAAFQVVPAAAPADALIAGFDKFLAAKIQEKDKRAKAS